MEGVFKIGGIFFLSAVKFVFAPGAAIASGFSFWQALLITILGGLSGVVFFYYFGLYLMKIIGKWNRKSMVEEKNTDPHIFNPGSRKLIKVKQNFGLIGLVILTPVLISIPIGSVVAARFFSHNRLTLPLLATSVVLWAIVITWISSVFKMNLFNR